MTVWQRWMRQPQRVWLRRAFFQVHLWTGIGLGLYVVMLSITGSALVYRNDLNVMLGSPRPAFEPNRPQLSKEAMTAAVETFRGLEHAMELVAEIGGVRFVNDSKATNVESALRSIESFDEGLVPIIGGRFKGGDLRLLRDAVKARAKAVVAIGEARPLVREALADVVPVYEADSLEEAVGRAFELVGPIGVVLLAPACASFDMFRDYAERGRRFKEEVAAIRGV